MSELVGELLASVRRETPVFYNLVDDLVDGYPDWKLTTHTDEEGRRYTLIEWADDDGEYREGTPGDFVSFVSDFDTYNEPTEGDS